MSWERLALGWYRHSTAWSGRGPWAPRQAVGRSESQAFLVNSITTDGLRPNTKQCYGSFIHDCLMLGESKMALNERGDQKALLQPHNGILFNGILFNGKNSQVIKPQENMEEPLMYDAF